MKNPELNTVKRIEGKEETFFTFSKPHPTVNYFFVAQCFSKAHSSLQKLNKLTKLNRNDKLRARQYCFDKSELLW